MFSLLRWSRLNRIPRWGFLFLLAEMAGPVARAAEPAAADPAAFEGREQTIEQLERLGQQVRESASALVEVIAAPAAPLELRRRAVLALATIGPENFEQAQALFELLANPEAELELRRTILMAFGEKDLFAPLLVPALLKVLDEPGDELLLRRRALFALDRFGDAEPGLAVLGRVIASPAEDIELRLAALEHLRRFDDAPAAAPGLLAELVQNRQEPARLREAAIETLRGIGPKARPAAPALVQVLSDAGAEPSLRLGAALALRQTGWPDESSTDLIQLSFDSATPAELRATVAAMMGTLDRLPPALATQWLPVLEDARAPLSARRLAARMLAKADLGLPDGVGLSARLLRDSNEDFLIRREAAEFLRRLGVHAAPARETLEAILLSTQAPAELRELASTALAQVAQAWLERPDRMDRVILNQRLASLDHAVAVMEQAGLPIPPHPQNLETVRRMRDVLRAEKASRWSGKVGDWAEAHPAEARWAGALLILGGAGGLLTTTWWAFSWIAPLRLGRLHEKLRRYDIRLPRGMGGRALGARQLSLLSCWGDHQRVLEAWTGFLRNRAAAALERYRHPTDANIFVDLPSKIEDQRHDTVPFDVILGRLTQPGAGVIIAGGAATGKSTLALRIATQAGLESRKSRGQRAPALPVWIDSRQCASPADLIESVRCQLRSTSARVDAPSPELVRSLLKHGQIVLILDGVSEWAAEDRDRVIRAVDQLGRPPILMTARHAGFFAERRSLRVELSRLSGPAVAGFVTGFIRHSGRELRPGDPDVLEACRYWTELTAGRAMPVDTVRLFAESLFTDREGLAGSGRPENLLELVRESIRNRNRQVLADPLPDELILQSAGLLAWTCAQHGGLADSGQLPDSLTPRVLAYLERELALIRGNPQTGEVGFLRPTVAEHLAAGHLIDTFGKDDEAWKRLGAPLPGAPSAREGLLARLGEAIWDACFRLSDPFAPVPIPEWLHAALEQRLTAPEPGHSRSSPRVRQLVRLVLAPENPERPKAINALAALGPEVDPVMPALLNTFANANEDLELRHAVLALLSLLGPHAAPAIAELRRVLLNRREHLFLRIKAIETLLRAAPDDPATVKLLVDRARDPAEIELLRSKAAQVVAMLNRPTKELPSASAHGSKSEIRISKSEGNSNGEMGK